MDKFISRKEALKILGIHYHTLYKLVDVWEVEIITIGSKNFYNIVRYLKNQGVSLGNMNIKKNICYCRVSSRDQKGDLERQIKYMRNKFPDHTIVEDYGSGLNFKRKGLKTVLDHAIKANLEEVVVTH